MKRLIKRLGVSLAGCCLFIMSGTVSAAPLIMPGAVDITDATGPEDFYPEIESVDHYDENGVPFSAEGSMLGAVWFYNEEEGLYCKYDNEGVLTTQSNYPYETLSDDQMGELELSISYEVSKNTSEILGDEQIVLYLFSEQNVMYAVRIAYGTQQQTTIIPSGKYYSYAVCSYDTEKMIADCPTLAEGFYVPAGGAGHMDLALEIRLPTMPVREGGTIAAALTEGATSEETKTAETKIAEADLQNQTKPQNSQNSQPGGQKGSLLDGVRDGISDEKTEQEAAQTDSAMFSAVLIVLLVCSIILTLLVIVLLVFIFIKSKKRY